MKEKQVLLNKKLLIQIAITVIGIIITLFGGIREDLNIMTYGMLVVWLGNVVYAFEEFQKRFFFFVFHCTFFTFLLGRAFFAYFRGYEWWREAEQAYENNFFAISAIVVSLICLLIGAITMELLLSKKPKQNDGVLSEKENRFSQNLQAVALIVFLLTTIFFYVQEGEKLIFITGKSYLDFYTGFTQQLPTVIYTIASFMKYSLCLYLATMPSKKRTILPLALYWISAIPSLIIGVRNPIVQNTLFIVVYFVLRNVNDNKEKWIGKAEKMIMLVMAPIAAVFLAAYAFIRSGNNLNGKNPFSLFVEFFYGQGVSINVLSRGYGHRLNLPERPIRNYTFGGIIDYFTYGTIGQKIFGTQALPDFNCYENARLSNNFSHNLSYLVFKDQYLNGHGLGSCYIIENFIDFGYVGIIVFNLVLGILLIYMMRGMKKNHLINTILLLFLTGIFYIPRAEATGWLTFIVTVQFWVCIGACYLGTLILGKWDWMIKFLKKMRLMVND